MSIEIKITKIMSIGSGNELVDCEPERLNYGIYEVEKTETKEGGLHVTSKYLKASNMDELLIGMCDVY